MDYSWRDMVASNYDLLLGQNPIYEILPDDPVNVKNLKSIINAKYIDEQSKAAIMDLSSLSNALINLDLEASLMSLTQSLTFDEKEQKTETGSQQQNIDSAVNSGGDSEFDVKSASWLDYFQHVNSWLEKKTNVLKEVVEQHSKYDKGLTSVRCVPLVEEINYLNVALFCKASSLPVSFMTRIYVAAVCALIKNINMNDFINTYNNLGKVDPCIINALDNISKRRVLTACVYLLDCPFIMYTPLDYELLELFVSIMGADPNIKHLCLKLFCGPIPNEWVGGLLMRDEKRDDIKKLLEEVGYKFNSNMSFALKTIHHDKALFDAILQINFCDGFIPPYINNIDVKTIDFQALWCAAIIEAYKTNGNIKTIINQWKHFQVLQLYVGRGFFIGRGWIDILNARSNTDVVLKSMLNDCNYVFDDTQPQGTLIFKTYDYSMPSRYVEFGAPKSTDSVLIKYYKSFVMIGVLMDFLVTEEAASVVFTVVRLLCFLFDTMCEWKSFIDVPSLDTLSIIFKLLNRGCGVPNANKQVSRELIYFENVVKLNTTAEINIFSIVNRIDILDHSYSAVSEIFSDRALFYDISDIVRDDVYEADIWYDGTLYDAYKFSLAEVIKFDREVIPSIQHFEDRIILSSSFKKDSFYVCLAKILGIQYLDLKQLALEATKFYKWRFKSDDLDLGGDKISDVIINSIALFLRLNVFIYRVEYKETLLFGPIDNRYPHIILKEDVDKLFSVYKKLDVDVNSLSRFQIKEKLHGVKLVNEYYFGDFDDKYLPHMFSTSLIKWYGVCFDSRKIKPIQLRVDALVKKCIGGGGSSIGKKDIVEAVPLTVGDIKIAGVTKPQSFVPVVSMPDYKKNIIADIENISNNSSSEEEEVCEFCTELNIKLEKTIEALDRANAKNQILQNDYDNLNETIKQSKVCFESCPECESLVKDKEALEQECNVLRSTLVNIREQIKRGESVTWPPNNKYCIELPGVVTEPDSALKEMTEAYVSLVTTVYRAVPKIRAVVVDKIELANDVDLNMLFEYTPKSSYATSVLVDGAAKRVDLARTNYNLREQITILQNKVTELEIKQTIKGIGEFKLAEKTVADNDAAYILTLNSSIDDKFTRLLSIIHKLSSYNNEQWQKQFSKIFDDVSLRKYLVTTVATSEEYYIHAEEILSILNAVLPDLWDSRKADARRRLFGLIDQLQNSISRERQTLRQIKIECALQKKYYDESVRDLEKLNIERELLNKYKEFFSHLPEATSKMCNNDRFLITLLLQTIKFS